MAALEGFLGQEVEEEILTASSSSSSSSDHGWQKVTYPKRQRKAVAAAAAKPETSDLRGGASSGAVFATVEKKALERRRAIESAAKVAAVAADAAAKSKSKPVGRRWGDSDEEESSEAEKEEAAQGVKKIKAKKPKKPKMTVQEAGSKIESDDLAAFLVEIGGSYESQQDIQLMRFADYYARAFRYISASQFPWTKIFKEDPLSKIVDVPISYIPEAAYKVSADWIGHRSNESLATFVLWSLDNLLIDLANQLGTLKGPKKNAQSPSTKGQVAMLAVIAITLRKKPDVLSNIVPTLRDDQKYHGADKLPIITWIIAQAAQGDLVVGLNTWVNYLLPLLSGKLGSNPQVRDLILQLAERILSAPKARSILLNGAARKRDRLVPPSMLDQLMHLVFVPASSRVKATERFEAIYPILKELALSGAPGSKSMKPVLLQLQAVCVKAIKENVPELTLEATDLFIWCLTQNNECLKQWEKIHLESVEASVVVLGKLSAGWKQQYAVKFSSIDILRNSLKSLREKNQKALEEDLDAGAKAAIKEADKHCKAVLSNVTRCSACGIVGGILVAATGIAIAAAIATSPAADSWDWRSLQSAFTSAQSL
ncbi:uncharacterized protein LOC144702864 [Wolffia australiana]